MTAGNFNFAIDFGTTYCSVYVLGPAGPIAVPSGYGQTLFPSSVSIKDQNWYVGKHSKKDFAGDYQVIHNVKRVIGRDKDDGLLLDDIARWQLPWELDEYGQPCCKINGEGVSAIEIAALLFSRAVKMVKDHFGKEASGCIVTVPAYFTSKQVEAIRNAAEVAGLDIIRVIIEPGAVALAALHDHNEGGNFLVCDVGGGTTDLVIVNLVISGDRRDFVVVHADGDNGLGGEDCERALERCFEKKLTGIAYEDLRMLCGSADRNEDPICIRWNGQQYSVRQSQYEKALSEPLSRLNRLLELESWSGELDGLILAGGACQLNQIRQLIHDMFAGIKFLPVGGDLGETVARGAALLLDSRTNPNVTFTNGLRRSIGIDTHLRLSAPDGGQGTTGIRGGRAIEDNDDEHFSTADTQPCSATTNERDQGQSNAGEEDGSVSGDEDAGHMTFIVRRNERLPTSDRVMVMGTATETRIHLYEGEHSVSSKNISLGIFWIYTLKITNFTLDVTVTTDMEVKVAATATDGSKKSFSVRREGKSLLSANDIDQFRNLTQQRLASSEKSQQTKDLATTKRRKRTQNSWGAKRRRRKN